MDQTFLDLLLPELIQQGKNIAVVSPSLLQIVWKHWKKLLYA